MKGLIKKELYNCKSVAGIAAIVLVGYGVIGANEQAGMDLFCFAVTLLTVAICINSFSLDQLSQFDAYALTLPITRRQLVYGKYVLTLLLVLCGIALSIGVFFLWPTGQSLWQWLWGASLPVCSLGLLLVSILIPLVYRFGPEKSRFILLGVILLPTLCGMLLQSLDLPMPSASTWNAIASFLPAIAVAAMGLSCMISCRIVEKKDY